MKELEPELRKFGKNLRRIRNNSGMTQEKLAESAGIATRVLQKIEAGQTNILITTAARLRKSLKCDWNQLMKS